MKTIISMTDFVLEKNKIGLAYLTEIDICVKYAKFLKQPLTLGIFVTCDENGNVLNEPERWNDYLKAPESFDGNKEWGELYQYEIAKEKVLFKGFESVDTRLKGRHQVKLLNANISGSSDTIQNDFAGLYFYDSFNEKSRINIIEDLLNFHPLQLTESALKQIFG